MRQNTDRTGEAEQPSGQRCRKSQFRVNDRRGAIDIHGDILSLALLQFRFDSAAYGGREIDIPLNLQES